MQISIRIIGIATMIFWIFLIGFAVSAAYSVKDLQLNLGNPTATLTSDDELLLSIPVTVLNRGYYDIDRFMVRMEINDIENTSIANGSTIIPFIPRGQPITSVNNITLATHAFFSQNDNLLFNDSELRIRSAVGMRLAQLIPVEASSNSSIPWGAPLYGFAVAQPLHDAYNSSQVFVTLTFENHAFFDLVGDIDLQMFNDAGNLVARGETMLNVAAGSRFNEDLSLQFPSSEMTSSGRLEVSFETELFNCGPLVIPYG